MHRLPSRISRRTRKLARRAAQRLRRDLAQRLYVRAGRLPRAISAAVALSHRKQLIFCLTNGRSGSEHLARLLCALPGIDARHEPRASFHEVMREAQHDPNLALRFLAFEKFPAIARSPAPVYVETSHLLAKGFLEPLMSMGVRAAFIVLTRPPRAIALSMFRLGTVPGRTRKGLRYYLSPEDPVLRPLPGWQALSDYQLCYWHALETEARQRVYASRAREAGLTVVETSLEALATPDELPRLAAALGIAMTPEDAARIAVTRRETVNRKVDKTVNTDPPADLDAQEAEVREAMAAHD